MNGREFRCFISIDVEQPDILRRIAALQASLANLGADLKIVDSGNVHVTLKFLGNVREESIPDLELRLGQVKFSPFNLELKGIGAFPGLTRINVIWIGIGEGEAEVERIYDQIEDEMASVGFKREGRRFNAHITLARVRTGRKKDELADLLRQVGDETLGSFSVEGVRLKRSMLKPSGPEYSTLYEVKAS